MSTDFARLFFVFTRGIADGSTDLHTHCFVIYLQEFDKAGNALSSVNKDPFRSLSHQIAVSPLESVLRRNGSIRQIPREERVSCKEL